MRSDDDRMERLAPLGRASSPRERAPEARGGAVEEGLPDLAPRGVGQLLDVATDSIKRRFPTCVGLAFLLWLPGQWLLRGLDPAGGDSADQLLALASANLVTVVVSMLVSAAVAVITYGTMQGRRVPVRDVLARLAVAMPSVFVTTILTALILTAGFVACILPAFFFMWRLLFAPTIVVLEGAGPLRAMRRSFALTRVGISRWLGTVLVAYFYMAPFTLGVVIYRESYLQDFLPVASPGFVSALSLGLESFLFAVSSAFYGVLVTVLFVDAKVRIEAFDLEMRFERIVASRRAPAGAPAPRPQGGLA